MSFLKKDNPCILVSELTITSLFKKPLMKKYYNVTLSTLLLFLLSFDLYGQRVPIECFNADVDLIIADVVWNADISDLASFYTDHNNATFPFYSTIPTNINGVSIPESFHMVVLGWTDYVVSNNGNIRSYTLDVSITPTAKPTIFVYLTSPSVQMHSIIDESGYVVGMDLVFNPTVAGVASTAAVMGRAGDGGLGFDVCIDINTTNRVGNLNGTACDLEDESYSFCKPLFGTGNRVSQDVSTVPDIYPNPVEHNLFVEKNGIDIQQVELLTLQGQTLNQISIRYGTDKIQVNTSSLPSGIYLLKLHTDNQMIVEKIIVQ